VVPARLHIFTFAHLLKGALPDDEQALKALTKPPDHRKVPITMRALIARINRKLKPEMETLKAARGRRDRADLGDFYIINFERNWLVAARVDPEAYGRELDALLGYEVVEQEE
jgi:hypothetical protein